MDATITYFEETGPANTAAVLALVKKRAAAGDIGKIVLASTRGDTARQASAAFADTSIKLIVIPHQYGFGERVQFDMELATELERAGHRVHWATMLFHTDDLYGTHAPSALANMLRTFGQGMKVCLEILLMAADGGRWRPGRERRADDCSGGQRPRRGYGHPRHCIHEQPAQRGSDSRDPLQAYLALSGSRHEATVIDGVRNWRQVGWGWQAQRRR